MSQPKLKVERAKTADLIPYVGNAKIHTAEQVDQIAASIEQFGFSDPIGVWTNPDGRLEIVEGHGRVMAANLLGMEEVPIIRLDHLDDAARRAYTHVHNQTTLSSGFDFDALSLELDDIPGFDWEDFGFEGPDRFGFEEDYGVKGSLEKRFLVPPLSVLNTRKGEWQDRKRRWREITGDLSETRDGEYGRFGDSIIQTINGGTSNFDPVLAETMYLWFCPQGGKVLDPFGGEQTKGVVAGECGYGYTGVEIRREQVALNNQFVSKYDGVEYICGDSNNLSELVKDRDFDFCLTSPPYYDLEVYSREDLSALGTYDEFMRQYSSIFGQVYDLLKDGSFCVVKVAEIRDKKTGRFRGFVPDTIEALCRAGFSYYNEIVLVNSVGTAMLRVNRAMRSRKVIKVHQNVLVFYKGDIGEISDRFGELDYSELEGAGDEIL